MTEGIENVYTKLSGIIHAPVNPEKVLYLTSYIVPLKIDKSGPTQSFVGQFLRLFAAKEFVPTADESDQIEGLLESIYQEWISDAGPGMAHGVWDHFKGGVYLSRSLGRSADNGENEVVYISLLHGTEHHRRCSEWNEIVKWPDGKYRSRFIYRGVDLESSNPPTFKVPLPNDTQYLVARTLFGVFTPLTKEGHREVPVAFLKSLVSNLVEEGRKYGRSDDQILNLLQQYAKISGMKDLEEIRGWFK